MDLHFDRFSIITVETWPILRCYVISIKREKGDRCLLYARTVFNTGNRSNRSNVPRTVICITILPFPVSFPLSSSPPGTNIFVVYTFPRVIGNRRLRVFPFREGRRKEGRHASPRSSPWETTLSFLLFFFLALEKALARKMGTAGCYLRHLVLPPVLYSRSPTYPCKRPRIPHRHLTRVFNATGHGISAWTRPRARPESRFEPRLALLSYGGSA